MLIQSLLFLSLLSTVFFGCGILFKLATTVAGRAPIHVPATAAIFSISVASLHLMLSLSAGV